MRKINCDICGIEIGSKLEQCGNSFFGNDPGFLQFGDKQKYEDICNNCTDELVKAVHDKIKELEVK